MVDKVAHPARFSKEIIAVLRGLIESSGAKVVHDPFAGTGERLGALCDELEVAFSGTEIEASFIVDDRVNHGDSTFAETYPGVPYIICCMAHGEKILTSDLRWIDVADVEVGQELLAFEEEPGLKANGSKKRRQYEFSTVTHSESGVKDCVEVTLSNGSVVVTTSDHPWLWRPYGYQGGSWVQAKDLMDGYDPHVAYAFPEWDRADSFDAGWLSGMFDGEGWLGFGKSHQQLAIAQAPGPLQERIEYILSGELGAKINVWESRREGKNPNMQTYVQGGLSEVFRILGELRPERLLHTLRTKSWSGTIQPEWVRVVGVRHLGERTVQSISTTSKTYIASGFLMHNTSPVYPNGICDHHKAEDDSVRNTYRAAVKKNEGEDRELHENNMGRYGYRNTKRPEAGGRSVKRKSFWEIAEACVAQWDGAEMVIVNVSDFKSDKEIEPFSEDWMLLMERHGWAPRELGQVSTPRYRNGSDDSRDERVESEWVLVYTK